MPKPPMIDRGLRSTYGMVTMIVLYVVLFCSGLAAAPAEEIRVSRSSPRNTIYTFLRTQAEDVQRPDLAARTLNGRGFGADELTKRAGQLKTFLDVRGLFVDLESVPNDPNYKDSATDQNIYRPFIDEPRITLERVGSEWYMSRRTVASVPDLYAEIYPFGLDRFVALFPMQGTRILGLYVWQHIGLAIILILGFIIGRVIAAITMRLLKRFTRAWKLPEESVDILKSAAKPFSLMVAICFFSLLLPLLRLPADISHWGVIIIRALLPFFGIVTVYRLVDIVALRAEQLAQRTQSTLDDQLVPLFRKALKFFVILVGLIFIFQNLNFDITALLAGVSIGGVALAFASQDTIKNVFGSVMIFADRPFTIGDWISVTGAEGVVEEVGFRSTRIRTFANSLVSIPNGRLADMTIDNMGLRVYRRYKTTLGINYSTSPEKLQAFVDGVKRIMADHPHTVKEPGKMIAGFSDFDASSLNVTVSMFFDAADYEAELTYREQVNMAMLRLAAELGVTYAYPSRTVYVESMPTTQSIANR
ncbi:MAG: hypothetical protein BGO89_05150 [Candidatus Kapaibacterium thiocyanatum]|uniref:Mechanosensitive ion channel protein n=1 Tax=Candidatus Kapaibacterium thiocyanatum TaxID=1895771 RepID=A0A1M3L5W8_9BACT|nr:MAG: hypothetical protein BGO89_05150 ['Candidatus Kapabacteria' thiocyanatum]